jgi:hypothetical protein
MIIADILAIEPAEGNGYSKKPKLGFSPAATIGIAALKMCVLSWLWSQTTSGGAFGTISKPA